MAYKVIKGLNEVQIREPQAMNEKKLKQKLKFGFNKVTSKVRGLHRRWCQIDVGGFILVKILGCLWQNSDQKPDANAIW